MDTNNITTISDIIPNAITSTITSITDIKNLINKSSKSSSTIRNATIKPGELNAKAKNLIDVIAYNLENF